MSVIVMKVPRQQTDTITMSAIPLTSRNRANRCRSFHIRYLELCRTKNTAPIAEIKKNNKNHVTLDFFGDKLSYTDWQLIADALNYDQMLHVLSIRLRKCQGPVIHDIDAERKARAFRQKPVIYTKVVFTNVIDAISNCIESNINITVLHLEGLPLGEFIESIVKSLSTNKSIKDVSFARSNIFDAGCESICNVIKYMENIEKLNLSATGLTSKGAEHIANMIKIQKISRYTEGWQQSLRYKEVDMEKIAGLRTIILSRNPQIGDVGLDLIAEVLKDDVWVKVIEMENCGLTDGAADLLIECLNINHYISEFNISANPGISKFLLRKISLLLRKEEDDADARTGEELLRDFSEGRVNSTELAKKSKLSLQQLIEQLKKTNEQLQLERNLRIKAEELNEKLTEQVRAYESELANMTKANVPEGFVVVKHASLQSIMKERANLEKIVAEQHNVQVTFVDDHKEENTKGNNFNYLLQEGENGLQFLTPLPEPTETPTLSARSGDIQHQQLSSHHQPTNIRKVKSEMKYMEPPSRQQVSKKRKDTKSDYDYATESDVPHFESNIGDTAANRINTQQNMVINTNKNSNNINEGNLLQPSNTRRSVRYASNVQIIKKYEFDEISLPTTRSHNSVASSTESDTLRCVDGLDCHVADFRNYMQHSLPNKEHGQGEGGATSAGGAAPTVKRSPRSLFLGLCDQ